MSKSAANDKINFDEIYAQAISWLKYFLSKWLIISLVVLVGAVGGFALSYFQKPDYISEMTFALEEQSAGGAYAGIASQFGVELGGDGGAFSGDNSLALLRSQTIIEKSLLSPILINGNEELLVNRYRAFSHECKHWKKNPRIEAVHFSKNEPRKTYSILKDSLLKVIFREIKNENLVVKKIDKKSNIISVKCTTEDELFCKYFVEALVKNASDFYIETKTKKARINVDILENKVDSVRIALDREIYGAAISRDQNMNTLRAQGSIQSVKKQMNVQVLSTMYGELVKNLELSKYTLMREEPLFQIIDSPILPLDQQKLGKKVGVGLGAFVSLTIILVILVLKRIIEGNRL